MEIEEAQELLRDFASARNWEQFHSPRNLILALVGEVGELAEQVQWRSDDDVSNLMTTSPELIAHEIVDAMSYLLRLADVLNVDIADALKEKLAINESRYPEAESKGRAYRPDRGPGR